MCLYCITFLFTGNPDSALNKHVNGRQKSQRCIETPETTSHCRPQRHVNTDIIAEADHLHNAFNENVFFNRPRPAPTTLSEKQNAFYVNNVKLSTDDSIVLCKSTRLQNTQNWFLERKKRITASKCYELYTYARNKNPKWPAKIGRLISPASKKLFNCEYGIRTESEAREWYEKYLGIAVTKLGFVVHPQAPFLGCSPDGCCFENNTLLEIKCAVEGAIKPLETVLPNLRYLSYSSEVGYTLKEAHTYYGQVQLNMLLLNLEKCDFIIYGKYSKCAYIINVDFNPIFAENLYNTLRNIYFKYYLPILCNEF